MGTAYQARETIVPERPPRHSQRRLARPCGRRRVRDSLHLVTRAALSDDRPRRLVGHVTEARVSGKRDLGRPQYGASGARGGEGSNPARAPVNLRLRLRRAASGHANDRCAVLREPRVQVPELRHLRFAIPPKSLITGGQGQNRTADTRIFSERERQSRLI